MIHLNTLRNFNFINIFILLIFISGTFSCNDNSEKNKDLDSGLNIYFVTADVPPSLYYSFKATLTLDRSISKFNQFELNGFLVTWVDNTEGKSQISIIKNSEINSQMTLPFYIKLSKSVNVDVSAKIYASSQNLLAEGNESGQIESGKVSAFYVKIYCTSELCKNEQGESLCDITNQEECDGVDNNCNGEIDENLTAPESDNKGICKDAQKVCDGENGWIDFDFTTLAGYENIETLCDGIDNDCDGTEDNIIDLPPGEKNKGICVVLKKECVEGRWIEPNYHSLTDYQVFETLCDGIDNNCDGDIDLHCNCDYNKVRNCGLNIGECSFGEQRCENGEWADCEGSIEPEEEICADGKDNNCNGLIDEQCDEECANEDTKPCGVNIGECKKGTQVCKDGVWSECTGFTMPAREICGDNLDNDCNGEIDENCQCESEQEKVCGFSVGECQQGIQICTDGSWELCAGNIDPIEELCGDKLDNNCNGLVDEYCDGCTESDTAICGHDVGECVIGQQVCTNEKWGKCTGGSIPVAEICDGKDNNCDGITDEYCSCIHGEVESCGINSGECQKGTKECIYGEWSRCFGGVGPEPEYCADGKDNDCDRNIDNLSILPFTFKQAGVCFGTRMICRNGEISKPDFTAYVENYQAEEVLCDGLDNDCDGSVDEGCECETDEIIECGLDTGSCEKGKQKCLDGFWGPCVWNRAPMEELCYDNLDNDCDGSIDEECAVQIEQYEICNDNIDNDFDTLIDENCILDISIGGSHACAIDNNKKLYCWGSNDLGQLATGSTDEESRAVRVGIGMWKSISVGKSFSHSCGILIDNSLVCWGNNGSGQLGNTTTDLWSADILKVTVTGVDNPRWKMVSAGSFHTCGILGNNKLYCWGDNQYGQLGIDNNFTNKTTAALVNGLSDKTVHYVACGHKHTCVIAGENRNLYCWGDNSWGQTGVGNPALLPNVKNPEQLGNKSWKIVEAGGYHTCAIRTLKPGENTENDDNIHDMYLQKQAVFCFGANNKDQLGLYTTNRLNTESAEYYFTPQGSFEDYNIDMSFNSHFDDIYPPIADWNDDFITLALGFYHTCVKTKNKAIWCAGDNTYGQISVKGTSKTSEFKKNDAGRLLLKADSLIAGPYSTCWKDVKEQQHTCVGRNPFNLYNNNYYLNAKGPNKIDLYKNNKTCISGTIQVCGENPEMGYCKLGTQKCENKKWGTCTLRVGPKSEICDGIDNDCDGEIDEDFYLSENPENCGECGEKCSQIGTVPECEAGACLFTGCKENWYNLDEDILNGCEFHCFGNFTEEICDGIDNDCNREVDDGLLGDPSSLTLGICAGLTKVCNGTEWVEYDYGQLLYYEVIETKCDGLDNDCDGLVDEDLSNLDNLECMTKGVCSNQEIKCNGTNGWDCGYPLVSYEKIETRCDDLDNDCDGNIDNISEEYKPKANKELGVCKGSVMRCDSVNKLFVEPFYEDLDGYENIEVSCDNLDNDCDGETDEDLDPPFIDNNTGVCEGKRKTCSINGWINPDYTDFDDYEFNELTCDGKDNDCDGLTDEDLIGDLADNQNSVCNGMKKVCKGASGWGEPDYTVIDYYEIIETKCDLLDNDCDGFTDNISSNPAANKHLGVCEGQIKTCVNGRLHEPDYREIPGYEIYLGNELTCDGKDNDCDGETDENLNSPSLAECNKNGVCSLISGKVCNGNAGWQCNYFSVDSYESNETLCDSLDNDCDGLTDKDLKIPCKVNGCDGFQTCNNGGLWWECIPINNDINEECNGIDDNCDGIIDNIINVPSADITNGICINAKKVCSNDGEWIEPDYTLLKEFETLETLCDGIDNDCDGETDEQCHKGTVFVSKTRCSGDILHCANQLELKYNSILDAADSICQMEADNENLSGKYAAWLSTDTVNAKDRIGNLFWYNTNGMAVANGIDDLTDGLILNPINYFADGTFAEPYYVYTGTESNGLLSSEKHCNNWSGESTGTIGQLSSSNSEWTSLGNPACLYNYSIYCFETTAEVCDGVDNDLDGETDEDLIGDISSIHNKGVCENIKMICDGENGWVEPDFSAISDFEENEISCDGIDNDCDGEIDNIEPANADMQLGICDGANKICNGSKKEWEEPDYSLIPGYQNIEVICDGIDNDCDGAIDEDCSGGFVFITKTECNGNLIECAENISIKNTFENGLDAADAICNKNAFEAGYNTKFKAWLSTSDVAAADRFSDWVWYNIKGELVAESNQALSSGNLSNAVKYQIDGTKLVDSFVFTGTTETGIALNMCSNWTSNDFQSSATIGISSSKDFNWTNYNTVRCNIAEQSLYCFQVNEEICDGKDNDNNGLIDDDIQAPYINELTGICLGSIPICEGELGWVEEYMQNQNFEYKEISCDGLDNDCDGQIDNNFNLPVAAYSTGVCKNSVKKCNGSLGFIEPNYSLIEGYEVVESLCDNIDNDCDGLTDEDLYKDCNLFSDCESVQVCENGKWGYCTSFPSSEIEICDGRDNNCDGIRDNVTNIPHASRQKGICNGLFKSCKRNQGTYSFVEPDYFNINSYQETETLCDGLDNDCDGEIDENCVLADVFVSKTACSNTNIISCAESIENNSFTDILKAADYICNKDAKEQGFNGEYHAWISIGSSSPKDKIKDGVWFNLKGEPVAFSIKSLEEGTLANPVKYFSNGTSAENVTVITGTSLNGALGKNCENWSTTDSSKMVTIGNPASKDLAWTDYNEIGCNGSDLHFYCFNEQFEICDGIDNDKDGRVDENIIDNVFANKQLGICAGMLKVCKGLEGYLEPDYNQLINYQETESICDGKDNDCDGFIDNIPYYLLPINTNNKGVCKKAKMRCNGSLGWSNPDWISIPNYQESELSCDGLDNDCDGETDEGCNY